mgnify:FL=1
MSSDQTVEEAKHLVDPCLLNVSGRQPGLKRLEPAKVGEPNEHRDHLTATTHADPLTAERSTIDDV